MCVGGGGGGGCLPRRVCVGCSGGGLTQVVLRGWRSRVSGPISRKLPKPVEEPPGPP